MKIGEILAHTREQQGLSQKELAQLLSAAGVTVTNQAISKWENGSTQPNAAQFLTLCRVLKIFDIAETFLGISHDSPFRSLNEEGRRKAMEYIDLLERSGLYAPVETVRTAVLRSLPLYNLPVSAGTGQFLDSDDYTLMEVGDEVPVNANFGVRICGDSMSPRFADGQIVWVRQQQTLGQGEIGIFLLNGDAYCKKLGMVEHQPALISLNSAYPPLIIHENSDFRVFGKVVQ
ncbi:MAG: LexA family transcriptional regulator [Oscillospiraceae bacterium]|nr:LexA family transcriptional regulator [Oscillospiraceae bacterium]